MDKQLLKEVREKYPIGTKVLSASGRLKKEFIVKGLPRYGNENHKDIYAVSDDLLFPVLLYDSSANSYAKIL